MGNQTSSGQEGAQGALRDDNSKIGIGSPVAKKRVSKFQSLRDHLKDDHKSVFEQHALKLHDSHVLRVYEIYQKKIKSSTKQMYTDQDRIVESMALRKKECKTCAVKLKDLSEKYTNQVTNLKVECLALEEVLAKAAVDVARLFEKAEQIDKILVSLNNGDGDNMSSNEIRETLPYLQNQKITRSVSGIDEEINNL